MLLTDNYSNGRAMVRWWGLRLLMVVIMTIPPPVVAGILSRETLTAFFPAPFIIGEMNRDIPIWPIFKEGPVPTAVGYVFESIDFAPIPGFAGTPVNLLVAIDPDGRFLDVRVLSQHEPVFVGGLGEQPLFAFVEQYRDKSLLQSIRVRSVMNNFG